MRQNIGFLCVKTRKMPCFGSCRALVLVVVFFLGSHAITLSLETYLSFCTFEINQQNRHLCFKMSERHDYNGIIGCDIFDLWRLMKKNPGAEKKKPVGTLKNQYEKMRSCSSVLDFFSGLIITIFPLFYSLICNP